MFRRVGASMLPRRSGALWETARQRSSAHGSHAPAAVTSSGRHQQQHKQQQHKQQQQPCHNPSSPTRRPHRRTKPNARLASSSAERRPPHDAPRLADSAQVLDALLALSAALYEDEAAASAVRVAADATAAVPPPAPDAPLPGDAYAAVEAAELMDLMGEPANHAAPATAPKAELVSSHERAPAPQAHAAASSSPVVATFAAADVPLEQKVLRLMDLCSASAAAPSAPAVGLPPAAAALVLPGLDMKAVLAHGAIAQRHLSRLCLARCDFSLVRWSRVTVEDCDLSRCLFYRAALDGVTFRRCRFTGCILKGVHCGGGGSATASATAAVRFEDCDFRLAAVGLICADTGATRKRHGPPVQFVRCNFDLSDFQFSEGLGDPSMFVHCSNTDLASRFPLRARGGIS